MTAELAPLLEAAEPPLAAVAAGGLTTAASGAAVNRWRAERLAADAQLLRLALPASVDRAGGAVFWRQLHGLLRARRLSATARPHVSFELRSTGGTVELGLWVPSAVGIAAVQRALDGAWPGASARPADMVPPAPAGWGATTGAFGVARVEYLPLATRFDADPLRSVLAALATTASDESLWIGVLARPAVGRRLAQHRRATGERPRQPAAQSTPGILSLLFGPAPPPQLTSAELTGVAAKAAEARWEVALRYCVATAATDRSAARRRAARARGISAAFATYDGPNRLQLGAGPKVAKLRTLQRGYLLSTTELSFLAHLPSDAGVRVDRASARTVAPVAAVPTTGKVLGTSDALAGRPVALAPRDARSHLHVIGATGSGKSTLLTRLVLDDVEAGRGAVVIDPKGDLIDDIVERLPASVAERTVLIDPAEMEALPSINVLSGDDPDLVTDHLVAIFRRVFSAWWGPRTDDILRSACLTLVRRDGTHLAQLPALLSDEQFRANLTRGLDDAEGLGGFWSWYESLSEGERARAVGPVMAKLRALLMRPLVRDLVGHPRSSVDMASVLDGGLLLARLPKGIVGDDTSRLVGSLLVARVWQAATGRVGTAASARRDASLVIDECHNFLHLPRSVEEVLAEARGYGLSLVLAHQHLGQLPTDLAEAVSANARNKIVFSVSPEDAKTLERHVTPELAAQDLSRLARYQAACRLVVDGGEMPPCTVATLAPPAPSGEVQVLRAELRRQGREQKARRSADATASRAATRLVDDAYRR